MSEAQAAPRRIPATAGETSAEHPWPVRLLSAKLTDYISKAPGVWVEGQVVQLTRRPGISVGCLDRYRPARQQRIGERFDVAGIGGQCDGEPRHDEERREGRGERREERGEKTRKPDRREEKSAVGS